MKNKTLENISKEAGLIADAATGRGAKMAYVSLACTASMAWVTGKMFDAATGYPQLPHIIPAYMITAESALMTLALGAMTLGCTYWAEQDYRKAKENEK